MTCEGTGGVVYTYEGPQFGAQLVEEACELCGGWHDSPSERADHERREARRANPGALCRAWQRIWPA